MQLFRIDCWLVGGSPLQKSVQLAGEAALEAATDLALALALGERQGDLRVVYDEVENTGLSPVDTTQLRAEVDDGQGRRFTQQPATADDTRGVLQPGQAGVITARFSSLPAPNRRSCTWPRPAPNRNPWRSRSHPQTRQRPVSSVRFRPQNAHEPV